MCGRNDGADPGRQADAAELLRVAAETPSDTTIYTTKFSDLSSYFQALQTRLGVTIALIALLASAAGAVRPLLPDYPSGARPFFAWAAVSALVPGFLLAGGMMAMPITLRLLIEKRLESRSLASPDEVERVLHDAFMNEIRRRHYYLFVVHNLLGISAVLLLAHAAVPTLMAPLMVLYPITRSLPPDEVCAAVGAPIASAACGFEVISLGVIVVMGGLCC